MRLSKYFLFVFFLFSFFISSFSSAFSQTFYGYASWYGIPFHGRKTASGLIFDMNALTAAHKKLPFGTKVRVTNLTNGRSVIVSITDRGPFKPNRIIDVSKKAAEILGFIQNGLARVKLEVIASEDSSENSLNESSVSDKFKNKNINIKKESFKPVNSLSMDAPMDAPEKDSSNDPLLQEDSKDIFVSTEETNSIPAFTKDVADFDMYKKSEDLYMNQQNNLDSNSELVQSQMARKTGTHNLDEYYRKHYYDNPDYYLGETNVDISPKQDPFIENNKKQNSIPPVNPSLEDEIEDELEDDFDFDDKYDENKKLPVETLKASPKKQRIIFKNDAKNYVAKKVYYIDLKEKIQHYSQDKLLYKIQFGAYSQILVAKTQQKRFKNLNIETEICILPNQYKGELVRLLGKKTYQDYAQVKKEQEKLKSLNIDSWIIQVND